MKNNKIILSFATLALLAPIAFTSCANQEESNNEIDTILKSLEKGFTFSGNVTQQRQISNIAMNGTVTPQGEPEKQDYRVEALYENSSDNIGASITHYGKLGEVTTIMDQLNAYVDEDGYCYTESLNYANEVEITKLGEFGNNLSFGSAGLYNFATILSSKDFTYDENIAAYRVDVNKMGLIFANILGRVNSGFYYTPISCIVGVTDGKFDQMEVTIENFSKRSFETDHYVEVQYLNSATFTFENIGTTKLERVKPVPSKGQENADLRKALDNIGNNFSIDIKSSISQDKGSKHDTYRYVMFTGEEIVVQDRKTIFGKGVLDSENHFVLKKLEGSEMEQLYCYVMEDDVSKNYIKSATSKYAKNYQGVYYYEDLLPTPKLISSDFFSYDNNLDEFICDDGETVSKLTPLLYINKAPLKNDHILNAQKLGIRLTDEGNVDYIKFYVNYQDLFNGTTFEGEIKMSFDNIGGTTL